MYSATETRDAAGGVTQTWGLVETVNGAVEPIKVDERLNNQRVDATATHQILIRFYSGLTHSMRFLYGSRVFYIVEILNYREMDYEMKVLVREEIS